MAASDTTPVIQPYEIGRVVLMKTSAWLLCQDEVPAFPTADQPAPRRAADGTPLPPRRLLNTVTAPGLTGETMLHGTTNHLARTLLDVGDARDHVVSHSVLNGHAGCTGIRSPS